MPEPIPNSVLRTIKLDRGFCSQERRAIAIALALSVAAAIASYLLRSPMPLVAAFCVDALVAASLEVEDV